jgi:DNA-binding NarL/FixJ family response regulator
MIRALAEAGDFASAGLGDADITIADRPPDVAGPVIALAPTGSQAIAQAAAWRCDVRAVVPADLDPMTLGAVITVIAAGLSIAPPDPARGAGNLAGHRAGSWAEALDHSGVEDEEPAAILTPREREVLTLLAAGASNKAIARTLGLSVHTVKFHVASLIDKLGARGRVEAVAIALRTGLIMV